MRKLTVEKCQSVIEGFKWMAEEGPGMSIRDEYDLQAYQLALPVLEQHGGWISCSERLPKDDGQYWGWWSEENRQGPVWFIERQSQFQSYQITHWMPLPAPPKTQPSTNPQIDNDGWIEWRGIGTPSVSNGLILDLKLRNGVISKGYPSESVVWFNRGRSNDIIAYRVIENDGREG